MRSVSGVRGGAGDAVHSVRVGRTILFAQEGKSSFVLSANLRKRARSKQQLSQRKAGDDNHRRSR
jgi:hypothetical protein